jgi:hypothetical protein
MKRERDDGEGGDGGGCDGGDGDGAVAVAAVAARGIAQHYSGRENQSTAGWWVSAASIHPSIHPSFRRHYTVHAVSSTSLRTFKAVGHNSRDTGSQHNVYRCVHLLSLRSITEQLFKRDEFELLVIENKHPLALNLLLLLLRASSSSPSSSARRL